MLAHPKYYKNSMKN